MQNILTAFGPMLYLLAPMLIIALAIAYYQSPAQKGKRGEKSVNKLLKTMSENGSCALIPNATILDEQGHTTQIDHILISSAGLIVIETKTMKGWIYGDEKSKTWTQKIYKKSFSFQNPLLQNYKHTKALEHLLSVDSEKIHSMIAFVGSSELKMKKRPPMVCQGLREVEKAITKLLSESPSILSPAEIQEISATIQSNRLPETRKTDKDHIRSLKKRHSEVA